MSDPPSGTITFLFTDIEGSTRRWEHHPQEMQVALADHDTILRRAIEANNGYVFKMMGDAFCAAFHTAPEALSAALSIQKAITAQTWDSEVGSLLVRAAMHTGAAAQRDGDYFGPPLNRVARLLSAGHGGQTLLSLATQELVRDSLPMAVTLQDMGEHRLKDLIRPERVFQLTAPGLRSDFPPLKTLDAHPNNLPFERSPLIGREKELVEIEKMLLRPDVGLLTITGPGGTGKTRLALQAAADVLDSFVDGVFFVNLAPISEPGLVVSTIAQALGVHETGGQRLLDTLRNHLKEKELLLILDNFEQVSEAAPEVGQLLAGAPHLKVLATSRVPLRIKGEKEYPAAPLSLPPSVPEGKHTPTPEQLTQYEAVRLFIERATDVKPDFAVTNENAPAVAEICVRLDGLPLAIELAAARIRLLPPQAILTRLQSRLKLLTGGARDVPARQQTLRGTIEWSYDLLDEGEKQLFRRLAVFVGGRTLEAIEAVCNTDGDLQVDVLDGVESLVSKSLMRQEEGVGGEPRFVMLETIHEYAREKLEESGEGEALQKEHALYFMRLAEEAEPHLTAARQQEWLDKLEYEHDNLRAALRLAREGRSVENTEIGLRLGGAAYRFWAMRGYYREGREELGGLLSSPAFPECSKAANTKALNAAGAIAASLGDPSARSLLEEGLVIAREEGDKKSMAFTLTVLGNMAREENILKARPFYEESLRLRRELGDKWGIAISTNVLGDIAMFQGDFDTSRSLKQESIALMREIGYKTGIADNLFDLGLIAHMQGDYQTARSLTEEGLALAEDVGDKARIAIALSELGALAFSQGHYTLAMSLFEKCLALEKEYGTPLRSIPRIS